MRFARSSFAISPPAVFQIPEPSRPARDDASDKMCPSISARPQPSKNTGDFKGDEKFVPGLKPRLRLSSLASSTASDDRKPVVFNEKYIDTVVSRPDQHGRPARVDCPTQRHTPCKPCTEFTRKPDSDTLDRSDPVPADAISRVRVARSVRSKSRRVPQCTVCSQLPC